MLRAIIADGDTAVIDQLRQYFEREQLPVQIVSEVTDGKAALSAIRSHRPDLAFLSCELASVGGLELLKRAKAEHSTAGFVLMTACGTFEEAVSALRLGAADLLQKPLCEAELKAAIRRAAGIQFSSNRQVNDILLYLQAHLSEKLTLESVAERFYISAFHLSHLFQKHMGQTCMACVHALRMEKAKELLRHSNFSIREIAAQTGYASLNNFYSHFRRATGMTPGIYASGKE